VSQHWDEINLPPLCLFWRYGGWWRWLILALILGGIGATLSHPVLGLGLLGGAAGLAWFFRNPSRTIASDAMSVISPVDGVVDDLVITDGSPWMQSEALRIGIFLSVLDVHATRAPITGTVGKIEEIPGGHGNALSLDAGRTNQRNEIWLSDAAGRSLLLRQIAGAVARRAVFAPRPGDTIRAGAVVGMIRFGSRVEVWLPMQTGYVATVWRGDRVLAGVSVLARVKAPGRMGGEAVFQQKGEQGLM
jgi:phosphatidylserine decarboxylase